MLEFFGLKEKPFSKTPDPRFMYLSQEHREALARMQFGSEEKEIIVITGDIGCGKTTLSRKLLDTLDERYIPHIIINPRGTAANFLKNVVSGFSDRKPKHFKNELMDQIYEILFSLYQEGKIPVLIIDEAQLINNKDVFEEIRLMTNFQMDDENLVSVIFLGQPELKDRLQRGNWEAFRQRVSYFYHLGPLKEEDTIQYLWHRFQVAGGMENPFREDAARKIFFYSKGVPRVINHIAQNALLVAFCKGSRYIDSLIVEEAAKEYLQWNKS